MSPPIIEHSKVSLVTFFTFVMSSEDHVLTAEKAFVCLTLFDIIRMPLAMLPLLIVYMIEVKYIQTVEMSFRKCMQKAKSFASYCLGSSNPNCKWWHGFFILHEFSSISPQFYYHFNFFTHSFFSIFSTHNFFPLKKT